MKKDNKFKYTCPICGCLKQNANSVCKKCRLERFIIEIKTNFHLWKKDANTPIEKIIYRNIANWLFDFTSTKEYSIFDCHLLKNTTKKTKKSFLNEHAFGRNTSAKLLIDCVEKLGIENLNVNTLDDILKKISFTVRIEKNDETKSHTKVNSDLLRIQKTVPEFDDYNIILKINGYEQLPEYLRYKFYFDTEKHYGKISVPGFISMS